MAVFTTFPREALERYVSMFGMGELHDFEPIDTGIENSNYFVTLERGDDNEDFVLTITEELGFDDVAFFNDLLSTLDRVGVPVPNPKRTLDGMASTIFCGKPAWLFPRLPGAHPETATVSRCRIIGEVLARIHQGAAGAKYSRENPYSARWARETFEAHRGALAEDSAAFVKRAIDEQAALESRDDLPAGIIHGDLFKDNALFDGESLTGIIDFYHACRDFHAQDIAITINAWAATPVGAHDPELQQAILDGYESVRLLEPAEREALPAFIRTGAARFVLTRLLSGKEEGKFLKDPNEFLGILRAATPD